MRNPNIQAFYQTLMTYHIQFFPHFRFAQFISNLEKWLEVKKGNGDIFYIEDDQLLRYIDEYANEFGMGRITAE